MFIEGIADMKKYKNKNEYGNLLLKEDESTYYKRSSNQLVPEGCEFKKKLQSLIENFEQELKNEDLRRKVLSLVEVLHDFGENIEENLVTLCAICHDKVHRLEVTR